MTRKAPGAAVDAEMDCRDDEYGGVLFSHGDFEKVRLAIKLAMEG